MRTAVAIATALAASIAGPAAAVSVQNPNALFTSATLVDPSTQYTGVVGVQTQTNAQFAAGTASVCSGAVIGSTAVLTAAHCIADDGSGIRSTTIFLPQFLNPSQTIKASRDIVDPGYSAAAGVGGGYDLGIVRLSTAVPTGTQIYALDGGSVASDFGTEAMVGLGTLGDGTDGDTGYQDGLKRIGYNQYEATFATVLAAAGFGTPGADPYDALGAPKDSRIAYDFDDGTAAHDVFGTYLGLPGLGYGDGTHFDTIATVGDSGAPHFENGRIVGVTSFGISGALFEGGTCNGPASVDPSAAGVPPGVLVSSPACTNSSFGEVGVDTRVAAFRDFIAANIPEPASWSLMIAGFGLIGGTMRRARVVA